MKVFLAIVAAVLIAGSLLADYSWRRWMERRREEKERDRRA